MPTTPTTPNRGYPLMRETETDLTQATNDALAAVDADMQQVAQDAGTGAADGAGFATITLASNAGTITAQEAGNLNLVIAGATSDPRALVAFQGTQPALYHVANQTTGTRLVRITASVNGVDSYVDLPANSSSATIFFDGTRLGYKPELGAAQKWTEANEFAAPLTFQQLLCPLVFDAPFWRGGDTGALTSHTTPRMTVTSVAPGNYGRGLIIEGMGDLTFKPHNAIYFNANSFIFPQGLTVNSPTAFQYSAWKVVSGGSTDSGNDAIRLQANPNEDTFLAGYSKDHGVVINGFANQVQKLLRFTLRTLTGMRREAAAITAVWKNDSDASRTSALQLFSVTNGAFDLPVEIRNGKLVAFSDNGTPWQLSIDNDGTLRTTELAS